MAVTIDIPGIGNIEAKNAASEQTLKEILKVMQGVQQNTKKKPGSDGSGDDGSSGGFFGKAGKAAGVLYKGFNQLTGVIGKVDGGFQAMNKAITGTIETYANMGDSLERAARVVPIFGSMLGSVASASVKLNDAFLDSAKSGAGFGGSVREFARSASEAGMTLENFGRFISKNGEGLLAFGGTTEEGARRFTQVSKALRQTSNELYALGFSTEDINQGLANYGDLLRKQGLQGTKTNAELAAGAKNYMKEIDALAKITGEERSAKEAQMKALATDAQFQMSMAGKSAEARESFMKLIGGFGPTLGNFVKDFVATGTLTTDENQRIAAALGGETMAELDKLRAKLQSNQKLSDEEQDRLRSIIKKASDAGAKQLGSALAATRENDAMSKAYIEGQQLQTDSVKNATAEQKKAAEEQEQFNKKVQEAQQTIAKFSNEFTVALANSGLLDFAIKAFGAMANIVQTLIVPAFNMLGSIVTTVGNFLLDVFTPLGTFIKDNLIPIMIGLAAGVATYIGVLVTQNAAIIAQTIATTASTAAQTAQTLATTALTFAKNVLLGPVGLLVSGVTAAVGLFTALYKNGWTLGTVFEALGDNLKRFGLFYTDIWLAIAEKIAGIFGKGDAIKEARQRIADERKELDEKEEARDQKREAVKLERMSEKERQEYLKKSNAVDAKTLDEKKRVAAENAKIDYNSSTEELAKQFAKAEGSPLIPTKEASAKAEATKKEIESKTEEKVKAEEKAKEEVKREKGGSSSPAPTQESAESLLAQLNNNMAQLVKLTKEQKDIGERQLNVQRGMTNDLFAA